MKYLLAPFVVLLLISRSASAQKVDRYCEILAYAESGKPEGSWFIGLATGQADSVFGWKDPAVLTTLKKVNQFRTAVDALNYMSSIGWTFVAVTPERFHFHFFFKKTFDAAELKQTQWQN